MNTFKNKVLAGAIKVQNNVYMKAISNAMMGLMPIMMISSIASLINAIDIGNTQQIMDQIGLKSLLTQINAMTIDVISVYVAFLVGYKLAEHLNADQLNAGIMSLVSFLILSPIATFEETKVIEFSTLGSSGMFVAMFGGILGARIYILCVEKNLTIKMPDSVPPIVNKSFAAIVPGVIVSTIMGIIYVAIAATPYGTLTDMIYTWVQAPLTLLGANVFACMIIVAFIEFLWFFGIHGVLAVYPVLMLVFYQPMLDNLAAYSAGQPLPHLFTIGFILNNRGARSFAVALLAIFSCKSEQLKAVGKIGLIPSMFGISEPIKFGIPQVMNIRMLIPLMVTPAVSVLSAYLLTIVGFMPNHNGVNIPTGFPIIFGGFLTNGWQGIIAQLIQFVLCVLIYIPFMRWQDKAALAEEGKIAQA
ncbi:PTS sugar transporter subunit IIC [Enterococcus gallinarum]|uniref:PTS sugar transporter subunit IIC n=1 Tax=Enterococcus gallinarum TaxID=1353 RepID=UPI001AD64418|nr:PTS transporter subunit EIIC [Enterococcus gallinarum]MBO6419604.1 PTS sugar transporter subunit IIC [Enterococcus gallinarum]MBO6422196.1 PTS sugar transporter subunit IIC [Enterococcus gallinarum]